MMNFNAKDIRFKIQDSRRGFTMVELVLVVGVLVVLSAVVLVTLQVPKYRGQAHNVQRKNDIKTVHNAFLLMARDKDDYTTGLPTSPTCIGTGSAGAFNLKGISWTANPSSTAMKFNVRACADSTCSADPLWLISSPDYYSPASFDIPNASFFQYKATFNAPENSWSQGAIGDPFDGTNAGTEIYGASVYLSRPGTGADGSLDLSSGCSGTGLSWTSPTCTINTDTKSVFNFTSINIPLGTSLNVTGSVKLTLYSKGNVTVAGSVDLNGLSATGKCASTTSDGGGGSGGSFWANGTGVGPGAIGGGTTSGGGGGFGAVGGNGTSSNGGSSYGSSTSSDVFYGGSGAAGGAGGTICSSAWGGAGGGGGGAIMIVSGQQITISGSINANGGNGNSQRNSGGGGAGGGILLQARGIANTGVIRVKGGNGANSSTNEGGAGGGAGGRVRMETPNGTNISIGTVRTSSCTGTAPSVEVCGGTLGTGVIPGTAGGSGSGTFGLFTSPNTPNFSSYSGTYTSSVRDLNQSANFTSISWNRTDPNDGEITLGDINLKGLWHFNETSGASAADSILVNNLTTSGITWVSPGKFGTGGRSLSFGGSAYAQKTSPSNLEIGASDGNWTLEAWVKPTGTAAGTIISKDGAAMHYYDLKLNTSNQVVAGLYDYNSTSGNYDDYAVAISTTALSPANWHHIVAVFTKSGSSTGTVQIYIDGKKDGQASNSSLPSNMSNIAAFRIGMRNEVPTTGFNGEIDEVAVWSKALTAPATDCAIDEPKISYDSYQYEICQHYNKGSGIPHLKFQAKSCNDALCDTETFIGPDGTSSTYYNSIGSNGSNSPLNLTANQWVQYKAYFATSDSSLTPSLDTISIKYNSSQISKPKLEDVTITASLDSAGKNQVGLLYSGYGDFYGGGTNLGQISPANSLKILDSGAVEYQGGSVPTYTSPIFSTQCFDIGPVLIPEYLPVVPKDPKIGTDENTGYFFSANSEMGTVTISAPAAELGEVIRN